MFRLLANAYRSHHGSKKPLIDAKLKRLRAELTLSALARIRAASHHLPARRPAKKPLLRALKRSFRDESVCVSALSWKSGECEAPTTGCYLRFAARRHKRKCREARLADCGIRS